jgi:type IV secretory pathway VirB4 component
MDRWKVYKKCDDYRVASPKSVSDVIEIKSIAENGIFEVGKGGIFTKTYGITDINYEDLSGNSKLLVLEKWCAFLSSNSVPFKITINNKNKNIHTVKEEVLFPLKNDAHDKYREIFNNEIEDTILNSREGIEQEIYITIRYSDSKRYEDARNFFKTVENSMEQSFRDMGSRLTCFDATERLRILHDFYRFGDEEYFDFDFRSAIEMGMDFKDAIVCSKLDFNPAYETYFIADNSKYVSCIYLKQFPSRLSDRFLTSLSNLNVNMISTIDAVPMSDSDVDDMLQAAYRKVEKIVRTQTKYRVKDLDFNSEISESVISDREDIKKQIKEKREEDQHYFYTMLNIAVIADSEEKLKQDVTLVIQTAKKFSCVFDYSYMRQREAINTILPIGVRNVSNGRNLQTKSLASLFPFRTQELYMPHGNWYGKNCVSKQICMANRKKLINPHGFIFGITGSGKTTTGTLEIMENYLNTEDDIIVIDPKNDYVRLSECLNGTFVDISPVSENRFNAFSYFDNGRRINIADEKSEIALSLCETCKREPLTAKERSIINRALKNAYKGRGRNVTLRDIWNELHLINEPEANDIILYLEMFITGSLNMFSEETNVELDNRLIIFGLRNMGKELRDLSMLVMLEYIKERIMSNYSRGVATWLYIDEFAEVLHTEYQRTYLKSLFMLLRSLGCIITGLTQNVSDLLYDYTTRAMLENAEFLMILKQNPAARNQLVRDLGIPEEMLKYIFREPEQGKGIIKCGTVTIPFSMRIHKDTEIYDIINTDFHELHERT